MGSRRHDVCSSFPSHCELAARHERTGIKDKNGGIRHANPPNFTEVILAWSVDSANGALVWSALSVETGRGLGDVIQLILALGLIPSPALSRLRSAVPRLTDCVKSICHSLIHQKTWNHTNILPVLVSRLD
jgi:hypothetical protein